MSHKICDFRYKQTGRQVFYDQATHEIFHANSPVFLKDDFLGEALDASNDWNTDLEGTGNAIGLVAAVGGTVQIDTGTAADKRNVLAGKLIYNGTNEVVFQARIRAVTSQAGLNLQLGLSDTQTETSGELPWKKDVAFASADTYDNTGDNVMFGVRVESEIDIWAVSAKAGVVQNDDTGTNLVLTTWHIYTITIDASGNARFYIDGALVASHTSATTAATLLCPFVGALITTGSAAAFIDIDFITVFQNRS